MRNPNLTLDEEVHQIIAEQLSKPPRDRSGSFSSSSSGKCERLQVFNYIGQGADDLPQSNDPRLQQIFYDGSFRHLRWQAVLLQAKIIDRIEVPLSWKKMRSEGSMDGLGVVHDEHPRPDWRGLEFGFELKGMNSWGYKSQIEKGIREDHLDQVHRYFLSSGLELFVIIYENKDTQEWTEWVITPNGLIIQGQNEELKRLNKWVDTQKLPPMLDECKKQTGKTFNDCPKGGKGGTCATATTFKELVEKSYKVQMLKNPQLGS